MPSTLLLVGVLLATGAVATEAEAPARVVRLGERLDRAGTDAVGFAARIDLDRIESASQLELELPGGRVAVAERALLERSEGGGLVWSGRTGAGEQVVLSAVGGRLAGTVFGSSGGYEIFPSGDGEHTIIALDPGDLPECGGAAVATGGAKGELLVAPSLGADGAPRRPRVDVAIVYAASTRAALGTKRNVNVLIQHYVDLTNVAFHNSEVEARVRLVGTEEVALPSRVIGSNSLILDWLSDAPSVADLRNATGADLIGILYEEPGTACGSAAMIYRPGGPTLSRAFFESRRVCGGDTFAHEVGHLMGADHDPVNAVVASGQYIYGRGHFYDGRFRTLMAYARACDGLCPPQPFFSNPKVRYDGSATGRRNERDNSRIISEFASEIERFTAEVRDSALCTVAPGHPDYCLECGPCVAGEGGCEADSECDSGLACAADAGPKFGLAEGVNVCLAEPDCDLDPGDPDYCRLCGPCGFGVGDCDGNRECQGGLTCLDDVGASFGLPPSSDVCAFRELGFCPLEPGDPDFCAACGPCRAGEGNCKAGSECATFTSCFQDVGPELGFAAGTNVCLRAAPEDCPFAVGDAEFCRQCGICDIGEGDCDSDRECGPGLECVDGAGTLFGLGDAVDVCLERPGSGALLKAPKRLKTVVLSAKKVRLVWTDRSKDEAGFHVEMSREGGAFERIATTPADATELLVKKLRSQTTYSFRLQAFNSLGVSKYTKAKTVTTP